jgi:hypothetical protein
MNVEVPEEWRQLGFSGEFHIEATIQGVGDLAEFEAKLPARVPFGTNSNWLALCVNHNVDPPTVVLVRQWEAAVVDLAFGPRG